MNLSLYLQIHLSLFRREKRGVYEYLRRFRVHLDDEVATTYWYAVSSLTIEKQRVPKESLSGEL